VLPLAGVGRYSSEPQYRTRWAFRANHLVGKNPDTFTPRHHRRVQRLRAANHAHTHRDGTRPRSDRRRPRGDHRCPRDLPLGSGLGTRGHLVGALDSPGRNHVGGTEAIRARAGLNVTAHPEETAFPTGEREPRNAIHSRLLTLSSCYEINLECRHCIIWDARVRTCESVPTAVGHSKRHEP
jgi:hypothetical protein